MLTHLLWKKQNLQAIFDTRKKIKKEKYGPIAELKRASFTPIIATCEAIFDKEAEVYMKRLATLLSKKWKIKLLESSLLYPSKNANLHS